MKKNITVNIFGVLYPIDEDAYELLNKYLDNMRSLFSRQEGGEEIADDIEARVAELMSEMSGQGERPVTIGQIQEIIGRIGNPEDLGVEEDAAEGGAGEVPPPIPNGGKPVKKLYRDVDHKLLGGVLAGLGCYIGVNPMWLRLLVLLLAFGSYGIVILVYLVCWGVIPPAVTPAERLEMKGEPVTLDTLGDEILDSAAKARDVVKKVGFGSFLSGVLQVICAIFKGLLYVAGFGLLIACGCLVIAVLVGMFWLVSGGAETDTLSPWADMMAVCPLWLLWLGAISLVVALSLTLYVGMHLLLRSSGRSTPMTGAVITACAVGWIVSVALFVGSLSRIVYLVEANYDILEERHAIEREQYRAQREQRRAEEEKSNLKVLNNSGWNMRRSSNLNGHYMKKGEHFLGDRGRRYLDGYNRDGEMIYEAVREVKLAPGVYSLSAVARTDGNGCEIFAENGSGNRYSTSVPVYGNTGGSVWADAKKFISSSDSAIVNDPAYPKYKNMAKVNHGKGYGWSEVIVDGIKVGSDSVLVYGVTNMSPSSSWSGTWLSATDFTVKPSK